jgi:PhoPQ-activated pathogenicity-related protein
MLLITLIATLASVSAQDLFLASQAKDAQQQFSWSKEEMNALDTYVSKADENYKWRDTGARVKMLSGGVGHVLNVTSQQWLDKTRAAVEGSDIWTHQVTVIVPKNHNIRNKAIIYITGGCNDNPSVPKATDEEPLAMDVIGSETGAIGVVLNQIPNCPMVYPSDPSHKRRTEDAVIAWGWSMFLKTGDPEWLPRLPMVKAAMQAMRAVQEYVTKNSIAEIDGWLVSGASKRGWTTWMVGAVNCPTCPRIDGIAPIVPIVPDLRAGLHHMMQAYGGWTFAFTDYMEANNLTKYLDDPGFENMLQLIDPINYVDRLEKLPKFVLVSSDDEFMMMEWTRLWWDKFKGEKHLMIANNAEHSMATGIVELLQSLGCFAKSLFLNGTRPSFDWDLDLAKGAITVRIPKTTAHSKVVLRHAHTTSLKRRDFRWVALPDGKNKSQCRLPEVGPIAVSGIKACVQPIIWTGTTLNESAPGVFTGTIPRPILGWTGAYIEVFFPSDTGMNQLYQFTTAGMVWPQTLPYPDCHGHDCQGHLV